MLSTCLVLANDAHFQRWDQIYVKQICELKEHMTISGVYVWTEEWEEEKRCLGFECCCCLDEHVDQAARTFTQM